MKDQLNEVADTWTEEEKAHCLEETSTSFQVWNRPGICLGILQLSVIQHAVDKSVGVVRAVLWCSAKSNFQLSAMKGPSWEDNALHGVVTVAQSVYVNIFAPYDH